MLQVCMPTIKVWSCIAGLQAIHTFQSGLVDGLLGPALCSSGQLLYIHLCVLSVHESAIPCLGSHEKV
jgi:hypothetical protein